MRAKAAAQATGLALLSIIIMHKEPNMENRRFKIVADSSANIYEFSAAPFACAPLKIIAGSKEWVDDGTMNVEEMVNFLLHYNYKSGSACPAPADWLDAFEDYEEIYCVTITGNLSGSYNSASIAAEDYMAQHPGRRVHVFDSLSAGPELHIIVDKIAEVANEGKSFEEVVDAVNDYMQRTGLVFCLESMRNLANNGRCSHLAAKAAGILNIRPVGVASEVGTLEMLDKPRGEKRAVASCYETMKERAYSGGKVYIANCLNVPLAEKLKDTIHADFPEAEVLIYSTGGLCSFYAEKGGLMIGFEKN